VKAGNTLPAELLGADPRDEGGRRVIFLSGDDASAKATVAELFTSACGCRKLVRTGDLRLCLSGRHGVMGSPEPRDPPEWSCRSRARFVARGF
jgi:predicted dinucleotide-binding enzyme